MLVCSSTNRPLPLEGRLLDGKFRFTKLLGAGGMGAVWKAQNIRVKKAVAIKLMHAEFAGNPGILERFRKEATAAGEIGNAHICDIYDFGPSVLGPYIVLEMLNGRSFGELIQQVGQVDPGLAVLIMRQALEGLEAAHRVGIVHRDLKPENIFCHEPSPGHLLVKLMDFGISKFSQGANEGGRTSAGVLMGTPEYMSPEQTEGAAGVDHRTDIWAMGAILYKALTGSEPFGGSTMAATLVAVSTKPHAPIAQLAPHVPPGLIAVVDKCLAKAPEDRFSSCIELSNALAPFENVGVAMPVMPAGHTQGPMTAAPITPAPGGTVVTGGGPPISAPPQATLITGGPPAPQAPKGTWSSEIGRPVGADDSWSIGAGPVDVRPQPTIPSAGSGGGGKGLIIGLVALLLIGAGGAAFFLMKKPDPSGPPDAKNASPDPVAKTDETKTGDTKTDDTKTGDTKTGDTKTGDTKTDETKTGDTKTDETKTGDTKAGEDEHTKKKNPKEFIFETDMPGARLPPRMLFADAKERCDKLDIGGVKTWRLPKPGELSKLKKNTKLDGRRFWTSEVSAGRVKVIDLSKDIVDEAPEKAPGVNAICVTTK